MRPSLLKAQMEVKYSTVVPAGVWNFSCAVGEGDCSQWEKNCSVVSRLSGAHIAERGGEALLRTAPNALNAEAFARTIIPRASTSKAGHAALSKPKTISELTQRVFSLPVSRQISRRTNIAYFSFHAID